MKNILLKVEVNVAVFMPSCVRPCLLFSLLRLRRACDHRVSSRGPAAVLTLLLNVVSGRLGLVHEADVGKGSGCMEGVAGRALVGLRAGDPRRGEGCRVCRAAR